MPPSRLIDPEDAAAVVISDDEVLASLVVGLRPASTPKIEVAWGHKATLGGQESTLISSKEAGNRRRGGESTSL